MGDVRSIRDREGKTIWAEASFARELYKKRSPSEEGDLPEHVSESLSRPWLRAFDPDE